MPAEIAQVRAAHCEEVPILIESELGLDGEIAALIIAEKRLASLAGPFHRPADPARGPGEEGIFGIKEVPRTEIAAHVPAHAAHLLGRHTQHLGEVEPQLGDAAAASGIEGVMPGFDIVLGRCGARLHRDAGDALHPSVEPNDVRGTRKAAAVAASSPTSMSMQRLSGASSHRRGAPGFIASAARTTAGSGS